MTARKTLNYSRMTTAAHSVLKRANAVPGRIMGLQSGSGLSYEDAIYKIYREVRAERIDGKKPSPKSLSRDEAQILLDALIAAGRWKKHGERIYFAL